jgi:hypothetical protein
MHGSMSAAGGDQASRPRRAAQARTRWARSQVVHIESEFGATTSVATTRDNNARATDALVDKRAAGPVLTCACSGELARMSDLHAAADGRGLD